MEMDLNWLSSKINTAVQIHVNKILVLKEHIFQSNTTKFFFQHYCISQPLQFPKTSICFGIVYSRLPRCSAARGSDSGLSLGSPTKVRLVSLFYLLNIPLKLKIKTKYKSCFGVNKILDIKNAQTLI